MIRAQVRARRPGGLGAASFRMPRYFMQLADRLFHNHCGATLRAPNLFIYSVHLRNESLARARRLARA